MLRPNYNYKQNQPREILSELVANAPAFKAYLSNIASIASSEGVL
jgi:hypothetical protein